MTEDEFLPVEPSSARIPYVPNISFEEFTMRRGRHPVTARERVSTKKMADSRRTEAMLEREIELDSNVRTYTAPPQAIKHYLRSREAINERQTATMEESVDVYINQMKQSLPPLEQMISPRSMRENEVPYGFSAHASPCRRNLKRIFDRTGYYKSQQKPLSSNLPDTYITQKFKEYIENSHEAMPRILQEAKISRPPDSPRSPRNKRIRNIIPRCAGV